MHKTLLYKTLNLKKIFLYFQGFVEAIRALKTVGLLSMDRKEIFNPMQGPDLTWKQIIAILNNQDPDIFTDSLRKIVSDRFGANKVETLCFC